MAKSNLNGMQPLLDRVKHIHLVGIGGSGMCGIAEVLLTLGYQISGSDLKQNRATAHLESLGVTIYDKHEAAQVNHADCVVVSSAINDSNPEYAAARDLRIPIVPRAEMLAELMRFRYGIAVAGTHGKTTTTSLIASILKEAGCDPTYVIGGRLNASGVNASLGQSQYLVAEADESDASFLYLQPMLSVVTNIDIDHMGTYQDDFAKLKETFLNFIHHVPFYGCVVLCIDDPVVKSIIPDISRPMVTYGFNDDADLYIEDFKQQGMQCHFTVHSKTHKPLKLTMNLPGRHNVLNALAAVVVARELDIDDNAIAKALLDFSGIARRFDVYEGLQSQQGLFTLVDDYGHHPREIAVTLEAARAAWPNKRVVMVFQPHRYSRTATLFDDFSEVLATADALYVLDVESVGEQPIDGITSQALCRNIRTRAKVEPVYVADVDSLQHALAQNVGDNDIVVMQGAGSIGRIAQSFVELKQL
jgi:UDP-N-acetylmuramate--alanine ligase